MITQLRKTKQIISRHLTNIPGWRTNRKIVVIESDDWGSIRMPSKEVYNRLINKGVEINHSEHNKYDSLASEEDLSALFEVLSKFKDKKNNHPVITANAVMTNPDFEKIRKDKFQKYHYELFTETLKKYNHHQHSFSLWTEGFNRGLFHPQFHGREHLNIAFWMRALSEKDTNTHIAFDNGFFGHTSAWAKKRNINFLSALDYNDEADLKKQMIGLEEGLNLFENILGYKSATFIAPRYIWSPEIEPVLKENGINGLQGTMVQLQPFANRNGKKLKKKLHYTGQKNRYNQVFTARNCFFEPALNVNFDWVSDVLKRMEISFYWGKPAIICSHRVNFIGSLSIENRTENLRSLEVLLKEIIKKWPDVEFLNSAQLNNLILNSKK